MTAKPAVSMPDDAWYAWEADETEQGWLLSYVDVLCVILAMLLVLLVNSLRSGESASSAEDVERTAPPPLPALVVAPPAPLSLALHEPLSAALPPPVAMVVPERITGIETWTPVAELTQDEVQVVAEVPPAGVTSAVDGVELVPHDGGVTLQIAEVVLFDSSKARLKSTAGPVLERAVLLLREFGQVSVAVQGHTDDRPVLSGSYRSNWELASARANAVAEFLLQQGFPPTQLRVESYADTRPVAQNTTEAGRAQNRRVELLVEFEEDELSRDGSPLGDVVGW